MQLEADQATRKKPDSRPFFAAEAKEASQQLRCADHEQPIPGRQPLSDHDALIKQARDGRLLEMFGAEQAAELAAECKTVIENQVRSCFVFQQSFCSRGLFIPLRHVANHRARLNLTLHFDPQEKKIEELEKQFEAYTGVPRLSNPPPTPSPPPTFDCSSGCQCPCKQTFMSKKVSNTLHCFRFSVLHFTSSNYL